MSDCRKDYAMAREDAVHKLTRLLEHLNTNESRELEDKHWGHVGSLKKMNIDLFEICQFMGVEL